MSFTALIVDDETLACEELKFLLSSYRECQVIGKANDACQALRLTIELRPEVVFLDIELNGMSGYEIARKMLAANRPPLIIFATAYDEYAVNAFELGAADYLLKPIESERLAKTIERIKELQQQSQQWEEAVKRIADVLETRPQQLRKLPVAKDGLIRLLDYDEIIYCRSHNSEVRVFTTQAAFCFSGTMNELEFRLGTAFRRVHKSYLVNLNHVTGVLPWFKGTYWLIMNDPHQTKIPVSKTKVKQMKISLGLEKH
jgi:two-component system, LytTR family, response regulator